MYVCMCVCVCACVRVCASQRESPRISQCVYAFMEEHCSMLFVEKALKQRCCCRVETSQSVCTAPTVTYQNIWISGKKNKCFRRICSDCITKLSFSPSLHMKCVSAHLKVISKTSTKESKQHTAHEAKQTVSLMGILFLFFTHSGISHLLHNAA